MTVPFTVLSKIKAKESYLSKQHPRDVSSVSISPLTLPGELIGRPGQQACPCRREATLSVSQGPRKRVGGRGSATATEALTKNLFRRRWGERRQQIWNGICKRNIKLEETSETRPREDMQLEAIKGSQRHCMEKCMLENEVLVILQWFLNTIIMETNENFLRWKC